MQRCTRGAHNNNLSMRLRINSSATAGAGRPALPAVLIMAELRLPSRGLQTLSASSAPLTSVKLRW